MRIGFLVSRGICSCAKAAKASFFSICYITSSCSNSDLSALIFLLLCPIRDQCSKLPTNADGLLRRGNKFIFFRMPFATIRVALFFMTHLTMVLNPLFTTPLS